jgi:hypothetical protein
MLGNAHQHRLQALAILADLHRSGQVRELQPAHRVHELLARWPRAAIRRHRLLVAGLQAIERLGHMEGRIDRVEVETLTIGGGEVLQDLRVLRRRMQEPVIPPPADDHPLRQRPADALKAALA